MKNQKCQQINITPRQDKVRLKKLTFVDYNKLMIIGILKIKTNPAHNKCSMTLVAFRDKSKVNMRAKATQNIFKVQKTN